MAEYGKRDTAKISAKIAVLPELTDYDLEDRITKLSADFRLKAEAT